MRTSRKSSDLKGVVRNISTLIVTIFTIWAFFTIVTPKSTTAQTRDLITPVSLNETNTFRNEPSTQPSISSDGRFIAYISSSDNLVSNEPTTRYRILIHDRLSGETIQVPASLSGEETEIHPLTSKISANGRFIVFGALIGGVPSNPTDPARAYGVFLYDHLTGETQQVAVNTTRGQNQNSPPHPTISGEGRFTAFSSLELNPLSQDDDGGNSIRIYDRVTDHNYFASIPGTQRHINRGTLITEFTDEGRIIIYHSDSHPKMLGYYNRVTTENDLRDYSAHPEPGKVLDFDISANGNTLAFISQIYNSNTNGGDDYPVYIHKYTEGDTNLFTRLENNRSDLVALAISGEGDHLAIKYSSRIDDGVLYRYDINTGAEILVDQGPIGPTIDLSYDGSVLVYTKEIYGISQVFVWDERADLEPTYILAGQITDSTGHPLALVTIRDDRGKVLRTDSGGYFWLNGISPGLITLRASKEGFVFVPNQTPFEVDSDIKNIHIAYAHDETLQEAKEDIGMPYSFNRGDKGPYHGFSSGYCTDLILDAYTWGVDFNIQFALEQDFRAHPWHFYRWRDARNAHDMWRYFSYSGQLQPHSNPYQPGDIVFFDWSVDGEIDHVALISEVNSRNRPRRMYDATGVINTNPSGLAAELPWEDFHEQTVRGFARWSGKYEPVIPNLPTGQVFQIALGGAGPHIRILDSDGNTISSAEVEIPGGRHDDWIWEQTISLRDQFSEGTYYLAVVSNPTGNQLPYQFTAQFIEGGLVNGRVEVKGTLSPFEIKRFPIILDLDHESAVTIELGNANRRIEGVLKKNQ